jgi:hypothetical protein
MKDFVYGASTIGKLNYPIKHQNATSVYSSWHSVSNSFAQAGASISKSLKEFSNAQRESKPKK